MVGRDILPRQMLIMIFPFHHLYPPRPVKIYLSSPPLETDMWPYHFKPVLPPTTDCDTDDGVHHTAVSESSFVDRVGNTDW